MPDGGRSSRPPVPVRLCERHLTKRDTLDFARLLDFLAFLTFDFARGCDTWLSRPESWFDCSFSRLLYTSASPPFAYALPPYEPPS